MIFYKFYKPDCAPCFALGRLLTHMKIPNEDIQLINVNVANPENKSLVEEYHIDKVPTIISKDNKKYLTGLQTADKIKEFFQEII